ncbi:hypothetical protein M2T92_05020 [Elizabethkingia miricola]|uniref:DUF6864 domain-containing function n=1 Tax=Elizabethkingia miricola TaxID=172045 RepID=UPI0020114624|nr:hypothetical protein [Elizabethkingia miricola]MCL1678375.1 hypothetical protein [Elizabethkingia miricola]
MVIAINKTTNKKKILIYNDSILMLDKNDDIIFELNDDILKYNIKFSFNEEGEPYSTNFWKDDEKKTLHYSLNNWDSSTYVEITKPILIEEIGGTKIWMKFRNQSLQNKEHRKFNISIWKEL